MDTPDITPNNEELELCKNQRDEYLQGWQRAKADLANYRRDEVARLEEIARYATEDMIRELLTVLDSFNLALLALEKQGPVEKGVYMIKAQIDDVLKKRGLERIETAPGMPFDPALHEAIAEGTSELPEGTIIDEIENGYRLHGRVLRPARVRISKGTVENA
jgi:molecular chaperone GrpE